jgi:hypothetical protein
VTDELPSVVENARERPTTGSPSTPAPVETRRSVPMCSSVFQSIVPYAGGIRPYNRMLCSFFWSLRGTHRPALLPCRNKAVCVRGGVANDSREPIAQEAPARDVIFVCTSTIPDLGEIQVRQELIGTLVTMLHGYIPPTQLNHLYT